MTDRIKSLTILYDDRCGFCVRLARWLSEQETFFPLEFIGLHTAKALERFPAISSWIKEVKFIVVNDKGEVYKGTKARIMCLYATKHYRSLSMQLAQPHLFPLANAIAEFGSSRRMQLASFLGLDANSQYLDWNESKTTITSDKKAKEAV